jgi:hypothetical protein
MKKFTKIGIFFIIVTLLTTAYTFAAMLGAKVKPLPEPVNLLIAGCLMVFAGHSLRQFLHK